MSASSGWVTVTLSTAAETPVAGTPPRPPTCSATAWWAATGAAGAPAAPVAAHQAVALQGGGRGGVPATGVSAVVLNVTVTQPELADVHGHTRHLADFLTRDALY